MKYSQKPQKAELIRKEHNNSFSDLFFSIMDALLNSKKEFTPGLCIAGMHIAKTWIQEHLNPSMKNNLYLKLKKIDGRSVDYAATHVG